MRYSIYKTLSELYEEEVEVVKDFIKSDIRIPNYVTSIKNSREVIDKNSISKSQLMKLDYYKLLINKYGKLTFPNRSSVINELMNIIPDLHMFHKYTIYKFDIESFFYSVDTSKSVKEIERLFNLHSYEKKFFEKYVNQHKLFVPGVGIHNSMIEILGKKFDMRIKEIFKDNCVFYARYVDDGLIILDESFEKKFIDKLLSKILKEIFGVKTKLNITKTQCFLKENNIRIEYLGYQFNKGQDGEFNFGIALSKLQKYKEKLRSYIIDFQNTGDLEKLDFRLDVFYKRIVFYGKRKNNNLFRWQVRGVSDSYKELKRFMKKENPYERITRETKNFFAKDICILFRQLGVTIPLLIKNKVINGFYLANFKNNKAILLHPKLGWKYEKLEKCLRQLYQVSTLNKSYSDLAIKFFHVHN
ncbi:reverse transcriptase domain-containing protein [Exiguobacterium sp. s6]|uniref:reverse transcriptase domain-containing protein n=1 Tax=Exiguobacterium sp. s6 TaxID=2751236 RepID=UPI001BE6E596|nr:reverse transcriptase domain-containing protein [Exiguobacterium sp. s6]